MACTHKTFSDHTLPGELLVRYVSPGEGTHTSHFATCPHADQHRGKGQGSLPGLG